MSRRLGPHIPSPLAWLVTAALLCLSSSGCGGGSRVREVDVDGGDVMTKNFKLRKVTMKLMYVFIYILYYIYIYQFNWF